MSTISDAQQMALNLHYNPSPPALPAAESPGPTVGAGDLWRVIKQRKWLILITFFVLYLLVVVATLAVYRWAPRYPAEAFVRFVPPPQTHDVATAILPKDFILHQLSTEAAQLKRLDRLQEVLALPEVKATEYYRWFGNDAASFEKCLYDLNNRLAVTPVRDSYLIRVGLALKNKKDAVTIVNALVTRHVAASGSGLADETQRRVQTLKEQRDGKERELKGVRDQIARERSKRNMPALESDRDVQADMITMLNNTAAELKTRAADIQAQISTVNGVDYRQLPVSAEMKVIIESDPVLRYYRQQVELLDIELNAVRLNNVGENHRFLQTLRERRQSYRQLEVARREELMDDLRSRQLESLRQESERVKNMQLEIQEQLAEREATQTDLDQTIQYLQTLQKDQELAEGALAQLNGLLNEAVSQSEIHKKEGRLAIAAPAREPVQPSTPNFVTWLGGGLVLSLLAAMGLAFLREFTDQAIRTPVDVARYGHLSVLGCVPLLDEEESDIAQIEHATRTAPQSLVAESFRQIRAHLTFSGPAESQRLLLITSPRPEDGKTAVAVNLAVTFAQGNLRTLLIDCNFRRAGVRKAFAHARPEGLSNILVGHSRFDDVVTGTELPNLEILSSGPLPPNPAELLGSPAMRELLTSARAKYDRVLLDGPPCLLMSDALLLATQVDGVVLVARAVGGTKGTLRRAREQLGRIGARVIGAVLNGVKSQPGGYFREQYREFYSYTEEEAPLAELPGGAPELEEDAKAGKS